MTSAPPRNFESFIGVLQGVETPGPPRWEEEDPRLYKSCALIAVGLCGGVALLDYAGPCIEWHAENYSETAEELGLIPEDETIGPGLWVWEGLMYSKRFDTRDGYEYDHVVEGEFREPTEAEWARFRSKSEEHVWDTTNLPFRSIKKMTDHQLHELVNSTKDPRAVAYLTAESERRDLGGE